jgi:hypothetical protein
MNHTILKIFFLSATFAFGGYNASITWEPSTDANVSTLRIYQITQGSESIAGYSSFPYGNLEGTFELALGCVEIYGKAYNDSEGKLSAPSNVLAIGCLCIDCKTEPSQDTQDGEIMNLDAKTLVFKGSEGVTYDIYQRQSLIAGDWNLVGTHSAPFDGVVGYVIDTTEHASCFYTVRPR